MLDRSGRDRERHDREVIGERDGVSSRSTDPARSDVPVIRRCRFPRFDAPTVGWGFGSGAPPSSARERLGERESTGGSDGREIASEIGGVAVEGRRRGGGANRPREGSTVRGLGVVPTPNGWLGAPADARRSRADSPIRARRPVVQRAEFLRAVRHGRQDSPGRPPQSTGTSVGVRRRDDAPDAPHGSKGTSARGAARSASPAAVSRACASRRRVRRTRSVTCARVCGAASTARASSGEPSCVVAPARSAGWFYFGPHPRAETAGREALIECSDAPGRLKATTR